jgi:hypothetical protein
MDQRLFSIIREVDSRIVDFSNQLEAGVWKVQQALEHERADEDYTHPTDALLTAEVVERELSSLLFHLRQYLKLTATELPRPEE